MLYLRLEPRLRAVVGHHRHEEGRHVHGDRLDVVGIDRMPSDDLLEGVLAPVPRPARGMQPDGRAPGRHVPSAEPVEHLLGVADFEAEHPGHPVLAVEDVLVRR